MCLLYTNQTDGLSLQMAYTENMNRKSGKDNHTAILHCKNICMFLGKFIECSGLKLSMFRSKTFYISEEKAVSFHEAKRMSKTTVTDVLPD